MATLENSCSTCYKATAPECAGYYLIGGLVPGTMIHAVVTDSRGWKYEVDVDDTPVDEDGNLNIVFPDGVNTVSNGFLTIQIFLQSDIAANKNLCNPQTFTTCDGDFDCIELSFYKTVETPPFWQLLCLCDEDPVCEGMCGESIQGIVGQDCNPIIGAYANIEVAPDGTAVGQLTVERYIDAGDVQHIHLYEWLTDTWVQRIDSSSRISGGFFNIFDIDYLFTNWEVSIDQGITWYDSTAGIAIDQPVSSITIWFRNIVNGCVYTNLPITPLDISVDVDLSGFSGYYLSPNSKVIYLYDQSVIVSAQECCSGIANLYPDMVNGPYQFNETTLEWEPMIVYTPSQFYPGTSIVISAEVPDFSLTKFQFSVDGGSTWGTMAAQYTKAELTTLLEIPIANMSYRSRLEVTLSDGCVFYSAENTLSE